MDVLTEANPNEEARRNVINSNDLRGGMTIEVDGQPCLVIDANHHKLVGRGGAIVRTKLKNLETGVIVDRTFNAGEKIPKARVETRPAQYLYQSGDEYYVMDMETYDQFPLLKEHLGDKAGFLKENMELSVSTYKGKIVAVDLPVTVDLRVAETDPGLRGDTASGGSKPATLETGAVVRVPLFINPGDLIRVDTRTGTYVSRV